MPLWQPKHDILELDGVWHRRDCPYLTQRAIDAARLRDRDMTYKLPRAPAACSGCRPDFSMVLGN